MKIRYLSLILLLLCCTVPLASATGMAKIYLSPDTATWKTGQEVQVKVMFDNNLNPVAKDISLYFDWNAEMLKYESTDFKVGHTTVAGLLSSHELNMLLGEFTNGYPKGEYPLAVMNFKVIAPGDTPILVKVARLNGMDGKPATFSTGKGQYSITGTAIATVTKPTTQPAAGQPTVIVVTPGTTYTLIPTVPQGTQAVGAVTTPPAAKPATTIQSGGAPGWPVMTFGATIPTPYPTTIETTVPTTVPTTVVTTVPTTTVPTTTVRTTFPTPTAEPITAATTSSSLGYSYGIAITDTPTPNETPTANITPTVRNTTLPVPLGTISNLTEEPTRVWPLNTTPTAYPTFTLRTTATKTATNNSSASAALAPAGSILGDAWLVVVAAIAGVAIVGLGVVTIRRNRDDDL